MKIKEIFYSNSIEEINFIKKVLEDAHITFEIVLNDNAHPLFGTNLAAGMQNILYKYVVQVSAEDAEKAIQVLEHTFDQDSAIKENNQEDASLIAENTDIKQHTELSVSIFLLLIFQHYSRFFAHIYKNITREKTKIILYISGILFFFLNMLTWVLSLGNIFEGDFAFAFVIFLFIFCAYEFVLNITDFIIEKQTVQLVSYLISLGVILTILITVFVVIKRPVI